jgi:hypothetical protein
MKKRSVVGGLLGLGGVALIAAAWLDDRAHRQSEVVALQQQIAALAAAQTADRNAGSPFVAPPAFEPAIGAPVDQGPSPAVASATAAPPSAPRPRKLTPAEVREGMETAFSADSDDPRWKPSDQRAATAKVRAVLPEGSELRSFDCKESLCRIETSHVGTDQYRTYLRAAYMDPTTQVWNAPGVSEFLSDTVDTNGPVETVAYLAREGHPLPTLP